MKRNRLKKIVAITLATVFIFLLNSCSGEKNTNYNDILSTDITVAQPTTEAETLGEVGQQFILL